MRTLYDHQSKAVQQLIFNKQFLLAHSCGTGKSLSALVAAKELNKPVTIVCPESAKVTWNEENEDVGANIVEIYNYQSFKKISNKQIKGHILIADEAHHLSHLESERTKQALALTDYDHLWLLSGTCIPDKPLDLYSILLLLRLREYTKTDWYRFRSKYAIMKKKMIGWKRVGLRRFPRYVQEIVGWKNLNLLREEIAPKSSFLKLEEVIDMPASKFIPIYYNLTNEEQKQYNDAEDEHLMKRLQLCSSFSAKRVPELVENILEKVVVFTNFIETANILTESLKGVKLIGETKDRDKVLETFRTSNDRLVTSFKTGSESLNLQVARYEVLVDLPQYLLEMRQALSRIYRTGQIHPCIYYMYIPRGTFIEKVFVRLQDKFDLTKKIFIEEDLDIMNLMKELK